jgi:hypothetical protein
MCRLLHRFVIQSEHSESKDLRFTMQKWHENGCPILAASFAARVGKHEPNKLIGPQTKS